MSQKRRRRSSSLTGMVRKKKVPETDELVRQTLTDAFRWHKADKLERCEDLRRTTAESIANLSAVQLAQWQSLASHPEAQVESRSKAYDSTLRRTLQYTSYAAPSAAAAAATAAMPPSSSGSGKDKDRASSSLAGTSGSHSVIVTRLEPSPPSSAYIPTYTYCPLATRNLKVDDERVLKVLPNFDDEDMAKNFDLDLYERMFEKVETAEERRVDPDENAVEFEAVRTLIEQHGLTPEQIDASQVFDNTVEEIVTRRNDSHLHDYYWLKPPDTDILDSFTNLFCRQCYAFDCGLHGMIFRPPVKGTAIVPRRTGEPCRPDCYKVGDAEAVRSSQDWTEDERQLLNAFRNVFPTAEPCKFAKMMGSGRTCREVYLEYTAQVPTMSPRVKRKIDALHEPGASGSSGRTALLRSKEEKKLVDSPQVKQRLTINHQTSEANEYGPCDHPGKPCGPDMNAGEHCDCYTARRHCEKFCHCAKDCRLRHPGCNCRSSNGKGHQASSKRSTCSSDSCPCVRDNRECDPDLCGSCGAGGPLGSEVKCRNVCIQRGRTKCVFVGKSAVEGYGLFAAEDIKRGELIGEYKGEVVSANEVERRGMIYDHTKRTYLFTLNEEYCVDAYSKGNAMRWINHSRSHANCQPKVVLVNGDHRIGIFSMQDIRMGAELLFDYGENYTHEGQRKGGSSSQASFQSQSQFLARTPSEGDAKKKADQQGEGRRKIRLRKSKSLSRSASEA